MTVFELLKTGTERLEKAGVPESRLDCEYLLAEAFHMPRLNLLLSRFEEVPFPVQKQFEAWLLRRESREPLQYILENQIFFGLTFHVTPDVLIPRCDTETLCEKALEWLPVHESKKVLDLCTGSGALAAAISKNRPRCTVCASDLSRKALEVAKKNALDLHVPVSFFEGDLFEPLKNMKFDMIVSNPPYIPDSDKITLEKEVLREPGMALFGGEDGLNFYRRIIEKAPEHLEKNGGLLFETGDTQTESVCRLMEKDFDCIESFSDLSGRPRVVRGRLKTFD